MRMNTFVNFLKKLHREHQCPDFMGNRHQWYSVIADSDDQYAMEKIVKQFGDDSDELNSYQVAFIEKAIENHDTDPNFAAANPFVITSMGSVRSASFCGKDSGLCLAMDNIILVESLKMDLDGESKFTVEIFRFNDDNNNWEKV